MAETTQQRVRRSEERRRAIAEIVMKPIADITAAETKRLIVLIGRDIVSESALDDLS